MESPQIGDWMASKGSVDVVEKVGVPLLPEIEPKASAHIQSLY
jgi:hypothetical protein